MGVIGRVAAGDDGPEHDVVGVTDGAPAGFADAAGALAGSIDREVTVETVDAADARRLLEDGDLDAVLVVDERQVRYDGEVDERAPGDRAAGVGRRRDAPGHARRRA